MAEEERTGVQNVWLLIIALGLGLIVVAIYNVHIWKVRQEGRGQNIRLLRVTRDFSPGDKIGADDLADVPVPKQYEASLGNVIGADNWDFAVGNVVNQAIEKDQWLLWGHITNEDTSKPSNVLGKGNVAVAVPLDPRLVPGDILRQNDRVNVLGLLSIGGTLKSFRIIEGVRVLAIGGEGLKPGKSFERRPKARRAARSYRNITIELSKEVSPLFANVLTHVSGSCWVELISARDERNRTHGRINPLLKDLGAQPNRPVKAEETVYE